MRPEVNSYQFDIQTALKICSVYKAVSLWPTLVITMAKLFHLHGDFNAATF